MVWTKLGYVVTNYHVIAGMLDKARKEKEGAVFKVNVPDVATVGRRCKLTLALKAPPGFHKV